MKKTIFKTLMSLILALTFCVPAFATTGITGVEYRTQDEILTLYHLLNLDETVTTSLSSAADLTNLTTSGTLSAASEQNALDTLNFVRYIAGLSYNVTIDETATQYAQDGSALLAYIGGGLNHYPDQPSGVSDSFYESAFSGTSGSNIAAGYGNLSTTIIHGWLADADDSNKDRVGHRRWALIPEMTSTGFGWVKANSSAYHGYYSAMYVKNSSMGNGNDINGIVWPAQNMPVEYFQSDYPWSYNTSSVITAATVKLTRQNDGQTWTITDDFILGPVGDGYIYLNNEYYGLPGNISFVPDNITYSAGDIYHVEITGSVTAEYTVEFFSLDDSYTTISSVTYGESPETTEPETTEPETTEPETTTPTVPASVDGASSWAQAELQTALDAGYPVALYEDHFTSNMTRGEFAHMLGMFASTKWSLGDGYDNIFTDLGDDPADAERNNCILALANWGVINGMTETTFAPDELVTREQAAKMLLAYENTYSTPNITKDITGYSDYNQISSWALEGVRYMNQLEVLNGNTETTLNPQGNITVQEAALMCYRLFIIKFKSLYS